MQIGAVSYMQPYVYNTNAISSKSMDKISAISDDALDSKKDVSALVDEGDNYTDVLNPIKKGQSLDFATILDQQMQMSRMNQARLFG